MSGSLLVNTKIKSAAEEKFFFWDLKIIFFVSDKAALAKIAIRKTDASSRLRAKQSAHFGENSFGPFR